MTEPHCACHDDLPPDAQGRCQTCLLPKPASPPPAATATPAHDPLDGPCPECGHTAPDPECHCCAQHEVMPEDGPVPDPRSLGCYFCRTGNHARCVRTAEACFCKRMGHLIPPLAPPAATASAARERLAAKGVRVDAAHPVSCRCKGTGTVNASQFSCGMEPCADEVAALRGELVDHHREFQPYIKRALAAEAEVARLTAERDGLREWLGKERQRREVAEARRDEVEIALAALASVERGASPCPQRAPGLPCVDMRKEGVTPRRCTFCNRAIEGR